MKDQLTNPSYHTLYMRKYREKQGEEYRKYQADYYASHKTEASRRAAVERATKWRQENLARDRATKAAWHLRNREKHLEAQKLRVLQDPDRYREYGRRTQARRRAKLKAVVVEKVDFHAIALRTSGCCGICGGQVDKRFDYDHIYPLAKGGAHSTENLQLAHPRCNRIKSARI